MSTVYVRDGRDIVSWHWNSLSVSMTGDATSIRLLPGFGLRVQSFGFRVLGSKSVFKESSIGHCNYLLRTLIPFKESSNHYEGSCYSNNNHITFKIFNCSCVGHEKLLECINTTFPLLIMCHLVVISRCITYLLGTVRNHKTIMKLSKDLDFCIHTQIFHVQLCGLSCAVH